MDKETIKKMKVLESFFVDGRLTVIPSKRKNRLIVFEEIMKSFNKDTKYVETDVNEIIKNYHEDFCTIRRDLVDEGFLNRTDNNELYWVNDVVE